MLPLPSNNWSKPEVLASWLELCALSEDNGIVLRGAVLESLRDSGMYSDESLDEGMADNSTPNSSAATRDEIWRVLERRKALLGDAWPLSLTEDTLGRLSGKETLETVAAYTAMLLIEAASSRWFKGLKIESGDTIRTLFESIVVASVSRMLGGRTARFGAPFSDEWPSTFPDRVKHLCGLFDLDARELDIGKYASAKQQDDSLDVVSRWKLEDEGEGSPYLLFQCATGEDWKTNKTGQPSMELWKSYVSWNGPQYKALAIPFALRERGQLDDASIRHGRAFVFDRLRLSYGNPDKVIDKSLRDDLVEWCMKKFAVITGWSIPKSS